MLAGGEITQQQSDEYQAALGQAFSVRVNWNGADATPPFTELPA